MNDRSIAYFSMEIALAAEIPTYSGGLGVLAADTVRSAADLKVPMVAVTLLHRKGYFRCLLLTTLLRGFLRFGGGTGCNLLICYSIMA